MTDPHNTTTQERSRDYDEVGVLGVDNDPFARMGGRRDVRQAQAAQFMHIGPQAGDLYARGREALAQLDAYAPFIEALSDSSWSDSYWDAVFELDEALPQLTAHIGGGGNVAPARFETVIVNAERELTRQRYRYGGSTVRGGTARLPGSSSSPVGAVVDVVGYGDTAVGLADLAGLSVSSAVSGLFAAGSIVAFLYTALSELDRANATGENIDTAHGIAYGAVHRARGTEPSSGNDNYNAGVRAGERLYRRLGGNELHLFNRAAALVPSDLLNAVYQTAVDETMRSSVLFWDVDNYGSSVAGDMTLTWPE